MEKEKNNVLWKKRLTIGAVVYVLLLLSLLLISHNEKILKWVSGATALLRPVIIGLVISYLCNPVFRFLEQKTFVKLRVKGLRRALSLVCTYLLLFLIILAIFLLILPQFIDSLSDFVSNYKMHVSSAVTDLNRMIESINAHYSTMLNGGILIPSINEESFYNFFFSLFGKLEEIDFSNILTDGRLLNIADLFSRAFSVVADLFLGLFVSIYLLSSKEKRYVQIMKLRLALFGDQTNGRITRLCSTADRCFGRFIRGKLWDSLIVGIIFYVLLLIAKVPYAPLFATLLGVANIIPFIGTFIGAVPSALIILLVSPNKVLIFLLIVLLVQMLDNNVIAPKIVGTNIGISSLCVVIALTTMTALWGALGALLSVPLFATALELLDLYTVEKLQKKGLPSGVESYYPTHAIVDPINDANVTNRRLQRWVEENVLRAQKKDLEQGTQALTRRDRFFIGLYRLAKKNHIMSEITDETNLTVSVKDAYKNALAKSDEIMRAKENAASATQDPPTR